MEIVRTALRGQDAASFFSEFLGHGQSALADMFEWELFDADEDVASGFENTSEHKPEDGQSEAQTAAFQGSEHAR